MPRRPSSPQRSGILLACALVLLGGVSAPAQLRFDGQELRFTAEPGQESVSGTFVYRNTGRQALTITEIRPSCGCTVIRSGRRRVEPNEKGEIPFEMALIEPGYQRKLLYVRTDHPQQPMIVLRIVAEKAERLRIDRRTLVWRTGAEPEPQQTTISVIGEEPVKIREVSCNREQFELRLQTVMEGREYLLTVTPKHTDQIAYAMITLDTDLPAAYRGAYRVYARVLRAGAGKRP